MPAHLIQLAGMTSVSHGTALTMVEGLGAEASSVRRDAQDHPDGRNPATIDFGVGPQPAMAIRWGDVYTAYHTTGIAEIGVFSAIPKGLGPMLRASGYGDLGFRTQVYSGNDEVCRESASGWGLTKR